MQYEVILSSDALNDIFDIYYYISVNDSYEKADKLKNEIYEKCISLTDYPYRGVALKEIPEYGSVIYQLFIKPNTIFYKIEKTVVKILAVLDGRRDLGKIYEERF